MEKKHERERGDGTSFGAMHIVWKKPPSAVWPPFPQPLPQRCRFPQQAGQFHHILDISYNLLQSLEAKANS